jgi:hypothetical protein
MAAGGGERAVARERGLDVGGSRLAAADELEPGRPADRWARGRLRGEATLADRLRPGSPNVEKVETAGIEPASAVA